MTKTDRRVLRTRELLQKALIDLISKRGYDAITVQDIVDQANVGRTTFYLHFNSKDELFMSCHEAMVSEFHFGPLYPHSREELLAPMPSPGTISAFRHLQEARALLNRMLQGKDSLLIMQRIRYWATQEIESSLRAAFPEADSTVPLDVLANYLAGALLGLVLWWLEKPQSHTPETLAQTFHRLQRAAIRDTFGLRDGD
jgi:AcrR family transcriptional regulator